MSQVAAEACERARPASASTSPVSFPNNYFLYILF